MSTPEPEYTVCQTMRPSVSIVVPFVGTDAELEALRRVLESVVTLPGDELVVADNSREPRVVPNSENSVVRVVRANGQGSSYHARNVGAHATQSEWILFTDADCVPLPTILDEYLGCSVAENVGAVAGGILPGHSDTFVARYSASRNILEPDEGLALKEGGFAVTANLLVRRSVYEQLGGFCEGIRSGGDVDFTWRLQEAGWKLVIKPSATVVHAHRETLRDLFSQYRRYGASFSWLRRRHALQNPARFTGTRVTLGTAKHMTLHFCRAAVLLSRGRMRDAAFAVVDGIISLVQFRGSLEHNRPRWGANSQPRPSGSQAVVTLAPNVPAPIPAAITKGARLEMRHRELAPRAWLTRDQDIYYWEDDSYAERLRGACRLALRGLLTGRPRHALRGLRWGHQFELAGPATRLSKLPVTVDSESTPQEVAFALRIASQTRSERAHRLR